ncbi:hypothetical protein [Streptomyces sp. NPDC059651]|uniref:hypothetical protein n=1 Tax=Streptomyces sp. NPDC059651 TaxID=3346897 RepID=UPI0036A9928C
MTSQRESEFSRAEWIAFALSLVSALVSLGFSTAALHLVEKSDPTYTYVLFNLARTIALVLSFVLVARFRSHAALMIMTSLMALVQLLDGVVGAIDDDPMTTYGPWGIAVASILALVHLIRSHRSANLGAAGQA